MPDVGRPTTKPVTDWLETQANGGAMLLSVCNGAAVVASAGLLDGHEATAHWLRLDEWENTYPAVDWVRGTRYVDDGDVISTAGILSGIDGTLHVVERLIGADAAADAARAIEWPHYNLRRSAPGWSRPGSRRPMPSWRSTPHSAGTARGSASSSPTGSARSSSPRYSTPMGSRWQSARSPWATRPCGPATDSRSCRAPIPGPDSIGSSFPARPNTTSSRGWTPTHPHHRPGFAFDAVLQDLARTTDVATAQWTAKALEYPVDGLTLDGPTWPWTETFRPLALAILGVLGALGVFALLRARRRGRTGA